MTIGPRPICMGCVRLHTGMVLTCDAFPGGIPHAILENKADHRQPYPGDGGKLFEPADAFDAAYAAEVFDPARRA